MAQQTYIELACHHNSTGLVLLQLGNGRAAVEHFRNALDQLNMQAQGMNGPSDGILYNQLQFHAFPSLEVPLLSDERFYVYNRGIHFHLHQSEWTLPTEYVETLSVCSAITMTNFALAMHHLALQDDKNGRKERRLERSVFLYNAVVDMLRRHSLKSDIATFLHLVSLNNKALITFELGRLEPARDQFHSLLVWAKDLKVSGWEIFSLDVTGDVSLNALMVMSTTVAACA